MARDRDETPVNPRPRQGEEGPREEDRIDSTPEGEAPSCGIPPRRPLKWEELFRALAGGARPRSGGG